MRGGGLRGLVPREQVQRSTPRRERGGPTDSRGKGKRCSREHAQHLYAGAGSAAARAPCPYDSNQRRTEIERETTKKIPESISLEAHHCCRH